MECTSGGPNPAEVAAVERLIRRNIEGRSARVFVSSTFRDCHGERDVLQRRVVPAVQNWCRSLRPEPLGFNAVDLRWGVTDKQVKSGDVLSICFSEIDRCRPFFIAILTDRYGWHNTDKVGGLAPAGSQAENVLLERCMARAARRYPWISEYANRGVTELEIRHGALRYSEAMKSRALFYFRTCSLPVVSDPDTSSPGTGVPESPQAAEKLKILKSEIRLAGLKVREYGDLSEFAALVEEDMKSLIQVEFASCCKDMNNLSVFDLPREELPPLEQERLLQEVFCRTHTHNFVKCGEAFNYLHQYVDTPHDQRSARQPVVVTGEPGMGKSTLLANIAQLARALGHVVCMHFPSCASGRALSQHSIMGSVIHQAVHAEILPPDYSDSRSSRAAMFHQLLSGNFTKYVSRNSSPGGKLDSKDALPYSKRLVVIIDALNMVENENSGCTRPSLSWLPVTIGDCVSLIVSTPPGQCLDNLRDQFQWKVCHLSPLDQVSRRSLINGFLGGVGKRLDDEKLERIACSPQTSNPLFLNCLLKELCVCATHDSLDELLSNYLQAQTIGELFNLILQRWENDFEPEHLVKDGVSRKYLVRDVMSSLCVSNRGMTEAHLQHALSIKSPVLAILLSAAAESLFVHSSGCYVFSHTDLEAACRKRYLCNELGEPNGFESIIRERLACFFEAQCSDLARQADELPFHLEKLGDKQRLREYISQLSSLACHTQHSQQYQLMQFWRTVGGYKFASEAYTQCLKEKYGGSTIEGPPSPAVQIVPSAVCSLSSKEMLLKDCEEEAELAGDLIMVAQFLWETGQYESALPLFKQHLAIMVRHGDDCHPLAVRALLATAECLWKASHQSKTNFGSAIGYCKRALTGAEMCSDAEVFDDGSDEVRARVLHRLGHLHFCVATSQPDVDKKVSACLGVV